MHPIRLSRALAAASLCLFTLPTFSGAAEMPREPPLNGAYMYLTPEDVRIVSDVTDRLLERGKRGTVVAWQNERSGNYGTVQLAHSFRNQGVRCKRIDQVVKYRNVSDVRLFQLTFCRIGGEWKLAG